MVKAPLRGVTKESLCAWSGLTGMERKEFARSACMNKFMFWRFSKFEFILPMYSGLG